MVFENQCVNKTRIATLGNKTLKTSVEFQLNKNNLAG